MELSILGRWSIVVVIPTTRVLHWIMFYFIFLLENWKQWYIYSVFVTIHCCGKISFVSCECRLMSVRNVHTVSFTLGQLNLMKSLNFTFQPLICLTLIIMIIKFISRGLVLMSVLLQIGCKLITIHSIGDCYLLVQLLETSYLYRFIRSWFFKRRKLPLGNLKCKK